MLAHIQTKLSCVQSFLINRSATLSQLNIALRSGKSYWRFQCIEKDGVHLIYECHKKGLRIQSASWVVEAVVPQAAAALSNKQQTGAAAWGSCSRVLEHNVFIIQAQGYFYLSLVLSLSTVYWSQGHYFVNVLISCCTAECARCNHSCPDTLLWPSFCFKLTLILRNGPQFCIH